MKAWSAALVFTLIAAAQTPSRYELPAEKRTGSLEQNGYPYDTYLLMTSVGDNADPMHAFYVLEKLPVWPSAGAARDDAHSTLVSLTKRLAPFAPRS